MKSVIAQGTTVSKAIEDALKKADMPNEFFVKLLEEAQQGFLGFTAKKAKIALFFKKDAKGTNQNKLFEQGTYQTFFDNPVLKKQIEEQLKELGLEIKPIVQTKHGIENQIKQMTQESKPVSKVQNMQNHKMQKKDISSDQRNDNNRDGQRSEYRINRRSRYYRPKNTQNTEKKQNASNNFQEKNKLNDK